MPNWYSGTSRSVPNVWFSWWPMFARPSWFRYARNAAPNMTPQTFPMPPRMTIERMKAEMLKLKSFGNVELLNDAKYAPATPPKKAPVGYAHAFVGIGGIARAA